MNMSIRQPRPAASKSATLRDVLSWAEAAGESYASVCEVKKIPARLGLSDDELHEIPASVEYFEKAISGRQSSVFARTQNPEKARKAANARIRALLKRFAEAQGSVQEKRGREEWDALIAWIKEREGFSDGGMPFAHGTHRALFVLRSRAGVPPRELATGNLDAVVRAATCETRKSIRKALKLLTRLDAMRAHHPGLAGHLPTSIPAMPTTSDRARRLLWQDLPAQLRKETEAAMKERIVTLQSLADRVAKMRAEGVSELEINAHVASLRKERAPKNPAASKAGDKAAVTWVFRAATERGWICPDNHALPALLSVVNLNAACDDQIERSKSSPLLRDPRKSQTLAARLKQLRALVRGGLRDPLLVARIENVMTEHHDCVVAPGENFDEEAEALVLAMRSDPALAARFVNAAVRIADEAERRLVDAVARGKRGDELAALRLYSVAVKYAVQLSRPLRPQNLVTLRCRSADSISANLRWARKGEHAELVFSKGEIKNVREIRVHVLGQEAQILWRWMSCLRSRYIELAGLEDTVYIIPGSARRRFDETSIKLPWGCQSDSTSFEQWAKASEIAGLDLTPHQCRHVVATLILALHPGNFALAASVLGDREDTVRRHYGRDNGEQAALHVREALLAQFPEALATIRKVHTR